MSEAGDKPTAQGGMTGEVTAGLSPGTPDDPPVLRRVDRLHQRKKRGLVRRLSMAGTVVLVVVVIAAILLLILGGFARSGKAFLGGYRSLIVLSGSMEPAMPIGGVVITKAADPASIKVGDIITFTGTVSDSPEQNSPFVTHRVVEILNEGEGLSFVTKGDANNTTDVNPVAASRVVGRVVLVIPWLGYLSDFVRSFWGWLVMIVLPATIIVVWELFEIAQATKKLVKARRG